MTTPKWPTFKPDPAETDWIGDKILEQEPHLDEILRQQREAPPVDADDMAPSVEVPVDPATEKKAFEDLMALLATTDEGDADTHVDMLSLDEFTAETFTPVDQPSDAPANAPADQPKEGE